MITTRITEYWLATVLVVALGATVYLTLGQWLTATITQPFAKVEQAVKQRR